MSSVPAINSSRIYSSGGIHHTASGKTSSAGAVTINEGFIPWYKIPQSWTLQQTQASEEMVGMLVKLFTEILLLGAEIVPSFKKRRGDVVVEASFMPPAHSKDHPRMLLPIPHHVQSLHMEKFSTNKTYICRAASLYIDAFVNFISPKELTHLLIIVSHEYGHLLSFRQGNHTRTLAQGIRYLHQGYANAEIIDRFTWLVFKEEVQAWHYGERLLSGLGFLDWMQLTYVKNVSLASYLQELHVEKASLKVFYRLSSFGDDFVNNCPTNYFSRMQRQLPKLNSVDAGRKMSSSI